MLDKLNYYGFCGIVNQWFSSYLSNRTQTTEIGSHISSKLNINCGVPQGSVLGPLLFLLYINDIQYCSSKLQFFLFADDTNALYAHKDLKTLELTVNAKFHCLYINWLASGFLWILKKSNYVIFHSYQKKSLMIPRLMFLTMKAIKRLPRNSRRFACSNRSINFDVKLDSTTCTVLYINTTKFFIDGKYLRQFAYNEMLTLLANSANQRQQ